MLLTVPRSGSEAWAPSLKRAHASSPNTTRRTAARCFVILPSATARGCTTARQSCGPNRKHNLAIDVHRACICPGPCDVAERIDLPNERFDLTGIRQARYRLKTCRGDFRDEHARFHFILCSLLFRWLLSDCNQRPSRL